MRGLSRRGFFAVLAGIGSASALVARSLNAAAATGERALTRVSPIFRRRPRFDEADLQSIRIAGRVRWFDAAKGYGFVAPDNGAPDVLLHVTCLRAGGYQTAREGARIDGLAVQRTKGAILYCILHMDESTATDVSPLTRVTHVPVKPESGWEPATVKWFNRVRGFGFLTRGEDMPDIFVHLENVQRCAFAELRPGQVVDIRWGRGSKGLMVADLRPHSSWLPA